MNTIPIIKYICYLHYIVPNELFQPLTVKDDIVIKVL